MNIKNILTDLGIGDTLSAASTGTQWIQITNAPTRVIHSPVDGAHITTVQFADKQTYDQVINTAHEAFKTWRHTPAPKRGEIVRQIGDALRDHYRLVYARRVRLRDLSLVRDGTLDVAPVAPGEGMDVGADSGASVAITSEDSWMAGVRA